MVGVARKVCDRYDMRSFSTVGGRVLEIVPSIKLRSEGGPFSAT